MKKLLINIGYFLILLIGVNFFHPMVTAAEESGIGFSVSPILPKTQIDKELGYYYLETSPGVEETFEVKLSSQKEDNQTVQMFVQDAYTGTTGNLTYGIDGEDKFKQDETLKDATSKLVTPMSETVELGPGEEKTVTFKVNPPKESYKGAKVGRLVFKSTNKEEEGGAKAIVEDYQYGVSIILSENGDDYNDGELNALVLNDVKATVKRGKRLVTANLQNPEPKRIVNIDLQATVTKKGSDQVVKQTKIPEFQFAPNSNVDLEVDWGLSELEAGEYTINIVAKNDYDKVHLSRDFRLTADNARKLNKDSAFKIKTPTWVKLVAVSTGVLTVTLSLVILKNNKKWVKLANRKRNKKRTKKR